MGPLGLLGVRHTRPALGVGGPTHEPEPMAGRLTPTGTTGGSLPPAPTGRRGGYAAPSQRKSAATIW